MVQHRENNYLPISHIITCLVSSSRFFFVYSCSQLACAGTSIFTDLLKIMTQPAMYQSNEVHHTSKLTSLTCCTKLSNLMQLLSNTNYCTSVSVRSLEKKRLDFFKCLEDISTVFQEASSVLKTDDGTEED